MSSLEYSLWSEKSISLVLLYSFMLLVLDAGLLTGVFPLGCATGNLGGSKGFTELGGLGGAGLFPTLGLITKFGLLGRVG